MGHPTPTTRYLNLNTGIFTDVGDPTPVDDRYNPLAGAQFDGIDDHKTSTQTPIGASSGSAHSIGFWLQKIGNPVGEALIYQLDQTTSNRAFAVNPDSSEILRFIFYSSPANFVQSGIADLRDNWNDGEWRRLGASVDGNVVDIYVDGQEASEYALKDNQTGAGFSGVPSTVDALSLAATLDGVAPAKATLARIDFWEGTALTADQWAHDFATEEALRNGEKGVLSGLIKDGSLFPDKLFKDSSLFLN